MKYSCSGCEESIEAVLRVTRPYLPGGLESRFTDQLPVIEQLRYTSTCAQCGEVNQYGRPGEPRTIWAHKFYCFKCIKISEQAMCDACGETNRSGQMGHAGTAYAKAWYCAACWRSWTKAGPQGSSDGMKAPNDAAASVAAAAMHIAPAAINFPTKIL